jgi:hypothetical protein
LRQLRSSCVAATVWPIFCVKLRPPAARRRSSSSRPESCIVMVDAPRVRVFQRLPQAADDTARQSMPLCSKKRLSSLSTMAVRRAGDTSASPIHWPRRTVASVRTRCSNSPLRSSTAVSEERNSRFTSSKLTSAQAGCAQAAASRAVARALRVGVKGASKCIERCGCIWTGPRILGDAPREPRLLRDGRVAALPA